MLIYRRWKPKALKQRSRLLVEKLVVVQVVANQEILLSSMKIVSLAVLLREKRGMELQRVVRASNAAIS